MIPVTLFDSPHVRGVNAALKGAKEIILVNQIADDHNEALTADHVLPVAVVCRIVNSMHMPSSELRIRLQVLSRAKVHKVTQSGTYPRVQITRLANNHPQKLSREQQKLISSVQNKFTQLSQIDENASAYELMVQDTYEPGELADLVAMALPLEYKDAEPIYLECDAFKRLDAVAKILASHLDLVSIRERISDRARKELTKSEHETLLREQIRQIQAELGEETDDTDELETLEQQLKKSKMPPAVKTEATKQLRRLKQLHPDTSEAALARTYIDWMVDLPWATRTKDSLDVKTARQILDEDHYGLEKTKERILDCLAVGRLKKNMRGPILLFVGPPGVGKTSLGRSIARALGRKFVRASVGGLRDEAEIRGHRRTYVGALPGRIIQGLKTAQSKNPVFILDEIDKIGSDFRGDPASVLLEVLDPAQNANFEDHYLNVPFDLSEVMFIATANVTDNIPSALLDRMEIIEIPGYTAEEKIEIAKRYIVPRERSENGLDKIIDGKHDFQIPEKSIQFVIEGYTRESGVRELTRTISSICRKVARLAAEGQDLPRTITPQVIEKFLGPVMFIADRKLKDPQVGVVTGLAWTPVGGEILTIEVSSTPGKGQLSLTGQLGEVMRESAMAALTYVQASAEELGINPEIFEKVNLHVHVPHGAIPKDGPSAGTAIATALVSVLTGKPISNNIAMTGEVTLRGNVLAVGGVREKALAALRADIPVVIIPEDNKRELVEYPEYLKSKVTFVPVKTVTEVIKLALSEQVHNLTETVHVSKPTILKK